MLGQVCRDGIQMDSKTSFEVPSHSNQTDSHLDIYLYTLRKLYFQFLSHWMGYDHGESFPFDFELNEIPFGSKSKGKLSPRSYPIQFQRKWKYNFPSVFERLRYLNSKKRTKIIKKKFSPKDFYLYATIKPY